MKDVDISEGKIIKVHCDKNKSLYTYAVACPSSSVDPYETIVNAVNFNNSFAAYRKGDKVLILRKDIKFYILGKLDVGNVKDKRNYVDYKPTRTMPGDQGIRTAYGYLQSSYENGDFILFANQEEGDVISYWNAQQGHFYNFFSNGFTFKNNFGYFKMENEYFEDYNPLKNKVNLQTCIKETKLRSWLDGDEIKKQTSDINFSPENRRHFWFRDGMFVAEVNKDENGDPLEWKKYQFFQEEIDTAPIDKPASDYQWYKDSDPSKKLLRISVTKEVGKVIIDAEDAVDLVVKKNINVIVEEGNLNIKVIKGNVNAQIDEGDVKVGVDKGAAYVTTKTDIYLKTETTTIDSDLIVTGKSTFLDDVEMLNELAVTGDSQFIGTIDANLMDTADINTNGSIHASGSITNDAGGYLHFHP